MYIFKPYPKVTIIHKNSVSEAKMSKARLVAVKIHHTPSSAELDLSECRMVLPWMILDLVSYRGYKAWRGEEMGCVSLPWAVLVLALVPEEDLKGMCDGDTDISDKIEYCSVSGQAA